MKYFSELTKQMYDTEEACNIAEAAHVKAESERKNAYQAAVAELDELGAHLKECQREQGAAYKKVQEASRLLQKKYIEFQKNFGRLPEKHYTDFILTRLL